MGKGQFHLARRRLDVHRSVIGTIKLAPISIGNRGHVIGILETTLNFQARDPQPFKLRQ